MVGKMRSVVLLQVQFGFVLLFSSQVNKTMAVRNKTRQTWTVATKKKKESTMCETHNIDLVVCGRELSAQGHAMWPPGTSAER